MNGAIEVLDARAAHLFAGAPLLERLCSGAVWSEGPVWMSEDDSVLWSDIPNNRMLRWSARDGLSAWREGVEFTNGHTRDPNGDLLHCSHGRRAVLRTRFTAGRIDASAPDEIVVDRCHDTRSAGLGVQSAGDAQQRVAHLLGRQPAARESP